MSEKMNEFAKLSSTSAKQRLNSKITVIYANCRDYDHKEKLATLSRKVVRDNEEIGRRLPIFYGHEYNRFFTFFILVPERKIKKAQKWNFQAEKNMMIKEIYKRPATKSNSKSNTESLSPSVDEWLEMSKKRRNTIIGAIDHHASN